MSAETRTVGGPAVHPCAPGAREGWLGPVLVLVGAVTLLRVLALAGDRTDLFVDETQYWFWGQHLAFGYYSKPPLIGWVIRAVTTLFGSDAPFFVRLPAPLFHGATALILGAIAARYRGRGAALWVAAGYATLPMVAVGSLLISTDTIMFPFLAASLMFWLRLCERPEEGETGLALGAGIALGLGFMAKYAAIYFLLCALLGALAVPRFRPSWRAAALATLGFAAAIWPNVVWNAATGFPTVEHTADNIGWVRAPEARAGLHWAKLGEFFVAQFGVMGPVAFGLLLWHAARLRRLAPEERVLLAFALPILAIVMVQALLSRAYANWAAAAYIAGALLVFWQGGRWIRGAAIALNLVACVALPVMAVWPDAVRQPDGRTVMHRYMGRAALSHWIIGQAQLAALPAVVTRDRGVIADLFYTGRNSGLAFYATPPQGRPRDQYELTEALPAGTSGDVLFVTSNAGAACAQGLTPLAETTPKDGAYKGHTFRAYRVPASCWAGGGSGG
ncbi:ArnT family glycosyltransferase [Acidimangrovimonas sediminis]|uniref:ArnT family glycosyltransferase n=1 Tax=Acidimangrovimonas sediminis TaxID=2056283 RepID=UPI000C7F8D6A|nr:glycosyltransferase family 39 protein [Acidimangrovimonas sediminis]